MTPASPLTWLYQHYQHVPVASGQAWCYLCGASCDEQHHVERVLADTFNSHFLARCPSSSWLCAACAWYLDSHAGHPVFIRMSLVVTAHTWRDWQRAEMKADITCWLTHGLDTDSYLVVSLTKKKHILLQAPCNAATSRTLSIQVEEQCATLHAQRVAGASERVARLACHT